VNAKNQREIFTSHVEAAAMAAFKSRGMIEKHFRIHGHVFALRFAGSKMAGIMSRALNHLAVEKAGEASLTINCWDVAGSGVACPLPEWPASAFSGRGEIRGLDTPEMRIAYFKWLKLLNVYLPGSGVAYYCLPDAEAFPVQQLGSPALTIFSWWMETLGWQFIHAAAVGTEQGAVLVAGHGGAGKSTLAFSSLGTPLRYISDDYCVVAMDPSPRVLALYNSGKLTEASLCLLQHLRSKAANAEDRDREKAVFFIHEQFPGEQLLQAPLKAIVAPHFNSFETSFSPIDWRQLITVLGDSTMRQLAGSGQRDFFRISRIVRSLPLYRLNHGLDSQATRESLLQLCAS
jgi:hypothetical protein